MGEITNKELGVLHLANRPCGLAYKSPRLQTAKTLKQRGLLRLVDKGENISRGRFIFKVTDIGQAALANYRKGAE